MTAPTVLPALDDALVTLAQAWADSPERDTVDAIVAVMHGKTAHDVLHFRLWALLHAVAYRETDHLALRLEDVERYSRALDRNRASGEHVLCCDDDCEVCLGRGECERCEAHHADLLADALLQLRHLLAQGRGREELDALDALAGAA